LNELYEQMDFILSGGALKLLVDFLSSRVKAALILEPGNTDLEVLDAVGIRTEELILKGKAPELASLFPHSPPAGKFAIDCAPCEIESEWSWLLRIRGTYWTMYVLLREEPQKEFLDDLVPFAGLISLWQTFLHIDAAEERLAHLSYIVLATKNTLASIFEPMPLTYYAAFLSDVLKESLFPRSISIFSDNGSRLVFLEGDELPAPERKGIFAQEILPVVPVVTPTSENTWEVVLPLADGGERIFCVGEWDRPLPEETLNFLELLGSLATRALSINRFRSESSREKEMVSSADFTIFSLSEALTMLQEQADRSSLLSLAADVVSELNPNAECFFVVRDAGGYVAYQKKETETPSAFHFPSVAEPSRKSGKSFFDLNETGIDQVLEDLGLKGGNPWPAMANMRYVFPLWERGCLEGFVALSDGDSMLPGRNSFAAMQIVAQFVAFELRKFIE
jgi:hypothetical protein